MTKMLSASGGLRPLTPWPGALPLDHAGGSAPRPRYRLVIRTRHGAPPPTTDAFRRLCAERTDDWRAFHARAAVSGKARSPSWVDRTSEHLLSRDADHVTVRAGNYMSAVCRLMLAQTPTTSAQSAPSHVRQPRLVNISRPSCDCLFNDYLTKLT